MKKPKDCAARQFSDQMICGTCGLAWDVNDPEPPKCKRATAPKQKTPPLSKYWKGSAMAAHDAQRLKRETVYQWCIEAWVDGEIEEHHHQDQLSQYSPDDIAQCISAAGGSATLEGSGATGNVLVLIREVGCDANGMEDRAWAYAERMEGKLVLNGTFDNGKPIPAQFCAELAAAQAV